VIDLYRVIRPLLFRFDAERAHGWSVRALKAGFGPRRRIDTPVLRQQIWGLDFPNPVGLAAGYDKHAEVPDALLDLGFGFVEVGGVTPKPQSGNPKPRLFRLEEDEAVINRFGLNSDGMATVGARLARRTRRGIVGVNLGKNKTSDDAASDYAAATATLGPYVDFIVCNVSSPNTPGLRALQGKGPLTDIIRGMQTELARLAAPPPLLLKIAPDLTPEDRRDIADVTLETGIAGLIVGNTTIERTSTLRSRHSAESGGLSGRPLFRPSTDLLRDMYVRTGGRVPLIGTGGVSSARDAYQKIRAGASLVQFYSAMVFHGPALVARVAHGLADLLRQDGFANVADAVGADSSRAETR
jgi:dihydroorotate dehydrogenase